MLGFKGSYFNRIKTMPNQLGENHKRVTVSLPKWLIEAINDYSNRTGIPKNKIQEKALTNFFKQNSEIDSTSLKT